MLPISVRLAPLVVTVALAVPAHAAIWHVDVDAAGVNDGTSWGDAFTDLQDALASASDGDTVRIAQGTYVPGASRGDTFEIPDGVRVVGGFAGDGEADPDAFDPDAYVTILSGDINGDDGPDFANDDENAYHVVTARGTRGGTIVRGVTIRDGRADEDFSDSGGGVVLDDAVLTLRECIVEDNRAAAHGGGIGFVGSSGPRRVHAFDCVIRDNTLLTSTGSGGGASVGTGSRFIRCVFTDNLVPVAGSGGAVAALQGCFFDDCEFIDNIAAEDGGAIAGFDLTILGSTFRGNRSSIWGGAALLAGECLVRECTFTDNEADLGGAIRFNSSNSPASSLSVIKTFFIDNRARLLGGAISAVGDGQLHLVGCDFLGNAADVDPGPGLGAGGAVYADGPLTAVNTLFAGNTTQRDGAAVSAGGVASIVNCTIVGNTTSNGQGAINAGATLNLHNCILWDNAGNVPDVEDEQVAGEAGANLRIRNCVIQGWTGALGGSQNNDAEPLLLNADGPDNTYGTLDDDPRLSSNSPARNSGRNDLLPKDAFDLDGDENFNERIPHDLDGDRRIRQSIVDRGAFEWSP